jgi:hypothetical protein
LKGDRTNPWLVVWEKAVRGSVALAARLRLSPQQRHDGKHTARERHYDQYGNVAPWRQP